MTVGSFLEDCASQFSCQLVFLECSEQAAGATVKSLVFALDLDILGVAHSIATVFLRQYDYLL